MVGHRNEQEATGLNHVDLSLQPWVRLVSKITLLIKLLRRRLMWAETSIGTREFLYVCVHKEKLKSMFEQYSIDLLRLLSLLYFCTIKYFVNSCSGPLVFILLSLSLELV